MFLTLLIADKAHLFNDKWAFLLDAQHAWSDAFFWKNRPGDRGNHSSGEGGAGSRFVNAPRGRTRPAPFSLYAQKTRFSPIRWNLYPDPGSYRVLR